MSAKSIPAFPDAAVVSDSIDGLTFVRSPGMTLRDYFAAKVLQGIVANPHTAAALTDARAKNAMESLDVMAEIAYGQADAMLRQRSK